MPIWLQAIIVTGIVISVTCVIGTISAICIYRLIYAPLKISNRVLDPGSVFDVLLTIINSYLNTYDTEIFNEIPVVKDAQFDNYFKAMSADILGALSEELYRQLELYITREAVVEIVCKMVRNFLTNKVQDVYEAIN
jgi:hypothetical protein